MISTKKDRQYLYQKLQEMDVLGKLNPILKEKGYVIRSDHRWVRPHAAAWQTPWVHQYQDPATECELWHDIFFSFWKWVPTYCQNCWKVVVAPRTIIELFDLYEVQKELERSCKCGIELRATDNRRYGGYFYNWGKDKGYECYKVVRQAINENISPDIPVVLKCACTEYEIECGPPADWVASEQQLKIEEYIKRYVLPSDTNYGQSDYMQAFVMLKWIHYAAQTSDMTYLELTDNKPITFSAKTYHLEELENGKMAE